MIDQEIHRKRSGRPSTRTASRPEAPARRGRGGAWRSHPFRAVTSKTRNEVVSPTELLEEIRCTVPTKGRPGAACCGRAHRREAAAVRNRAASSDPTNHNSAAHGRRPVPARQLHSRVSGVPPVLPARCAERLSAARGIPCSADSGPSRQPSDWARATMRRCAASKAVSGRGRGPGCRRRCGRRRHPRCRWRADPSRSPTPPRRAGRRTPRSGWPDHRRAPARPSG